MTYQGNLRDLLLLLLVAVKGPIVPIEHGYNAAARRLARRGLVAWRYGRQRGLTPRGDAMVTLVSKPFFGGDADRQAAALSDLERALEEAGFSNEVIGRERDDLAVRLDALEAENSSLRARVAALAEVGGPGIAGSASTCDRCRGRTPYPAQHSVEVTALACNDFGTFGEGLYRWSGSRGWSREGWWIALGWLCRPCALIAHDRGLRDRWVRRRAVRSSAGPVPAMVRGCR